jgi:ketosteroid isomerase-like protein
MCRTCLIVPAVALLLGACKPAAPAVTDDSAAAAEAIKAADAAWEKAVSSKDTTASLAALESGGAVLGPNSPAAATPEAIKGMFATFWAMPAISIHWTATRVEAAKSGELGYSMGSYQLSWNDAKGKPMSDKGKYVTVWRKQADGSWKVVYDIFNSDQPATGM